MSEKVMYVLVGVAFLLLTYVLALTNAIEPVAGIGLIHILSGLLYAWVVIRLWSTLRALTPSERAADPVFIDLFVFLLAAGIFNFIDFIPHYLLIIANQPIGEITIVHWSGHIFRFLELIMAARIGIAFFNPKLRTPITIIGVILAVIGLGASLLSPDRLVAIPNAVHPLLLSTEFFAKMDVGLTGLIVLPAALYLIVRALGASTASVRMLATLLGIGIIFDFGESLFVNYGSFMVGPSLAPLFINFFIIACPIVIGFTALTIARDKQSKSVQVPPMPPAPTVAPI